MEDPSSVQQDLEKLGLTKNQANVYLLLIIHKGLRVQEIAKLADMPRSSVYDCLKGLFELGLVEEVVGDTYKIIRPYSVGIMRHGLNDELIRIQQLKREVSKLEKSLSLSPTDKPSTNTTVRYYKNRSGARQLYWNTLKATNTVYVMSDWGRGRYVGMKYYQNFVTESRSRNISEKVLINPTDAALDSIRRYTFPGSDISRTRLEDIRTIDSRNITIKGDTLMYDNIYANIFLKDLEITGFEIESPQFVETQRSIFKTLWNSARPVVELM